MCSSGAAWGWGCGEGGGRGWTFGQAVSGELGEAAGLVILVIRSRVLVILHLEDFGEGGGGADQLIIALRQQTARVLVVHHKLRGHGAARLLLPALRRLAATLIPVQLVNRFLKGLTMEELILATSSALDTRLSVISLSSSKSFSVVTAMSDFC